MNKTAIILLAAGKGTRMLSDKPKVLFELAGEPLLAHALTQAQAVSPDSIHIVVGYQSEQVMHACAAQSVTWHTQDQQLGTAHAVSCALAHIADETMVLISYGDMPLLQSSIYRDMLKAACEADFVLLTTQLTEPYGYGRIMRDETGRLVAIVEQADASPSQCDLNEVNVGVVAAKAKTLRDLIADVGNNNKQREYYLTDCLGIAVNKGLCVSSVRLQDSNQARGVNSLEEMAQAERLLQQQRAHTLAKKAFIKDTSRIDIRGEVNVGKNVVFDVGVVLGGKVEIGDDVYIGPYTVIKDVSIAAGSVVEAFCYLEEAEIGCGCRIGPYARVRPATILDDESQIGNFVEVKKSHIGTKTKINHLSYIGDSEVGKGTNIGAGTITCNYDGANKHKTTIGDNVFVGSGTQIVAPIQIGKGATIGAGSTICRDAEADALTLSRSEQKTIKGWQRPRKNKG